MTFGIDIASSQRDIDLVRAKSEGVEFVIVKMGGLNVAPQYVAPYYRAQVDRAIAAGLPKGHYYLIGRGQSPEQQAEFFASNLHRFDPARDILALDNEALDGNGTRWGDGDAARFIRRVIALTGIPAARVWHYAGASDYRATGAWPELTALGVRFWWAAYGGYPTGRTPDHEPSLQGSIPRWDVHQYSSRVAVAGYALDGNYSRATVNELFGGAMPNTPQGAIDYARSHPLRDGGSWAGWCASFCYRAGGFSQAFESAMVAGNNAGPLNPNWGSAPPGAIHYWAGVGGLGHCAFELGGSRLLMASSSVTDRWGTAVGTITFQDYARLGIPYRGWSMRWGSQTLSGASTSGGGYTPIEEDDMPLTAADINLLLNSKAYTHWADGKVHPNPPTISEVYREIDVLYQGIYHGGPLLPDSGKSLVRSIAEINAKPTASVSLTAENIAALAQSIAALIPEDGDNVPTPEEIAEAVVQAFGDNLSNG